MSEILAGELRCNACWRPVGASTHCFTTSCGHLFDRACAEKFFSTALTCPLCNAALLADEITPVAPDRPSAPVLLGFALFHADDVLAAIAAAVPFLRGQTALYGTREIWIKAKDADATRRRALEAENLARTLQNDLSAAGRETEELRERLSRALTEAAEEKTRRRGLETTIAGGRGLTSAAGGRFAGLDAARPRTAAASEEPGTRFTLPNTDTELRRNVSGATNTASAFSNPTTRASTPRIEVFSEGLRADAATEPHPAWPREGHSVVLVNGGASRGPSYTGPPRQYSALSQALQRPVTPAAPGEQIAAGRSFGNTATSIFQTTTSRR